MPNAKSSGAKRRCFRKWLAGAITTAIACAAVFTASCSRGPQTAKADAESAPTVAVATVTRAPLARTLDLPAEFRPFQEVDLHAKVAGYVKEIYVDVGSRVRNGQLLATLEIPELQDEVTQAKAQVSRSQEEVTRAQSDLRRAQSAHDLAHVSYTRLQGVVKTRPDLIAQQDMDTAQAKDQESEAEVDTAKASLAVAQQQSSVDKANLSKNEALYAYSQIRAPFDGVVTKRYADKGTMLAAGTSSEKQAIPLVQLSQNGLLRLQIPVPVSAVSLIHAGSPATIHVPELKKIFEGKVTRFADVVTMETRTMDTEIDVPNPKLEIVPGMYATVSLQLDRKVDVLTIPLQAVERSGDSATVMVVNSAGELEQRTVTTGLETPEMIEIVSGLKGGEQVVVGGRSELRAGERVKTKTIAMPTEGEPK
ncbi:MAG TPA: efflux RND transporter periplasmic adaptor subunit [Candidatus Acidoferrales bacterium]|nr:efflux RND transporter periplasmic adaptor subunit [Candidatus Acidoferrales bacterium]